jgi:hypothetical protein
MSSILDTEETFGDVCNRLAILELNLEENKDLQVEYDSLKAKLEKYFTDTIQYNYSILKDINKTLYLNQIAFKSSTDTDAKKKYYFKINEDKDRCSRVKNKLNRLINPSSETDYNYGSKKAFFIGHMGLGDHLTCLSIIRYLATIYDEVKVACKSKNYNNLKLFFSDDPTITFHQIEELKDICVHHDCPEDKFLEIVKGYNIYSCGSHNIQKDSDIYDIPFSFYEDVCMPYRIFWDYFYIADMKESKELYSKVVDIPYVFIHNGTSIGKVFDADNIKTRFNIDKNTILFINPNENVYKSDHKFYSLAQEFINKPLSYYKDIIINANSIFVTDSSFFCLAMNLEVKTDQCYYISRNGTDYNYIYSEKYKFKSYMNRKIFMEMIE